MKPNAKTILLIITALIVAAGAYWYFFVDAGNDAPLTASAPTQNASQAQFQALIAQLRPINFDTGIFNDPRFFALQDLTTPISPEPTGRPDPFAPIPGVRGE
jgi:flagellar basal body-associated protein FliL